MLKIIRRKTHTSRFFLYNDDSPIPVDCKCAVFSCLRTYSVHHRAVSTGFIGVSRIILEISKALDFSLEDYKHKKHYYMIKWLTMKKSQLIRLRSVTATVQVELTYLKKVVS